MPLPEGQLCTMEDIQSVAAPVLAYLENVGYPATPDLITTWIKNASRQLEIETNRQFLPTRATEWYDGNDTQTLVLRRFPVLKVHQLRIWGGRHFLIWEFPPDKIVYEGEYTPDQYRQSELVVRRETGVLNITLGLLEWFMPLRMQPPLFIWNRRFVLGRQNIEVDYTAGMGVPDPNDPDKFLPEPTYEVRYAATLLTAIKVVDYAVGVNLGVVSRTLGERTENFGGQGIFGTLRQRWMDELYGTPQRPGLIMRLKALTPR